MVQIRRVEAGDETSLAYIQTESWKAAFDGIIPAERLAESTKMEHAVRMYRRLLAAHKGNGYILELDGKPHCIAWWDATREKDMPGTAELICIHSLRDNWHKGYGSRILNGAESRLLSSTRGEPVSFVEANRADVSVKHPEHNSGVSGAFGIRQHPLHHPYIREL